MLKLQISNLHLGRCDNLPLFPLSILALNILSTPAPILDNTSEKKKDDRPSSIAWNPNMAAATFSEAFEKATWIGFDLDDTLHDFRGATSKTTEEVLCIICESYRHHEDIRLEDLRVAYSRILREKTAGAFTDGKTSHEYRAERFSALLRQAGLPEDSNFIQSLVSAYEDRLSKYLAIKDGAAELLHRIRDKGKKIMIITEGPQDAQERTVEQLLEGHFDTLVTTNKFGLSKVDGLFSVVLEQYEISPSQMVYIGDSLARDVQPALKAGMFAVHFDEKNSQSTIRASCTIDCLLDLVTMLED